MIFDIKNSYFKKICSTVILFLVTLIPALGNSVKKSQQGYYLKLSGGVCFFQGGDFNDLIDKNTLTARRDNLGSSTNPNFYSLTLKVGKSFSCLSLELESGYLFRSFRVEGIFNQPDNFQHWSFSAIPVLTNINYQILRKKLLTVNLNAGGGLYFGKLNEDGKRPENITWKEKSTDVSFGLHAGIILDFKISESLTLYSEGRLRFVNFKKLQGEGSSMGDTYSGELFYIPDFNRSAYFTIGQSPEMKSAVINLNGVSLNFGIKFIF